MITSFFKKNSQTIWMHIIRLEILLYIQLLQIMQLLYKIYLQILLQSYP